MTDEPLGHDDYDEIEAAFNVELAQSLGPRSPEVLYDVIEGLGLAPGATVVDVGCGEGRHAIELARRFGATVLAVDPLERRMDTGRAQLATLPPDVARRVTFRCAAAEQIPAADGTVDLVLCREMLYVVDDLVAALREFRRVLAPTGRVVVYQLFNTGWLEPAEAVRFWGSPAAAERNDPDHFERAVAGAGLSIDTLVDLGSETVESAEERDGKAGRELLAAARLLRSPDRYVEQFGQSAYEIKLTDALWFVYRMIGKLTQRVYVLERA